MNGNCVIIHYHDNEKLVDVYNYYPIDGQKSDRTIGTTLGHDNY